MHVDTYIITFDTNGGFPGTFTREIHAGQTISSIAGPNPQKEGCGFKGWFCRKQDGSFINFGGKGFSDITHDLTVIAQWNPNNCTIRYDGNGGRVVGTTSETKKYWEVIQKLPTADRTGYNFVGWFTHPQYGKQITQLTQVTGNATYYAHWKTRNYNVTFNTGVDDQTVPPRTLTYGKPIGALPTLERTGYTFEGWWYNSVKVTSTTLVMDDMVVVAHWQPIDYKVEWDMGGHGIPPSNVIYGYNIETGTFTPNPPADVEGWDFDVWNPTCIEKGSTGDRKFVALWNRSEYTITFSATDADNGTTKSWTCQIKWEQEISDALEENGYEGFPEPKRTGYEFLGWYTDPTGGNVVYETQLYTTDGNSTYYARWEANEYTITFDSQEGEPESYEKVIKYDQNPREIMPDPRPLKTGYSFIGWYDSPAGGHPIEWDEPYHFTNDTIYYAIWMPITYTVAYDGNGKTGGSTESSVHTYDVYKSLTPNGFVRENTITYNPEGGTCNKPSDRISATFLGWSLVRNGYKQFGDRQSVINLAETYGATVNLYAKWELGKVELPEVTRRGYTFLGWYTEATDGTKIGEAGYTFEVSDDMSLHAHWLANKYMIVLDSRGGTPAVQTLTVNFNQRITSDMFHHPTRTGYEFTKWTDKDGHDVNFTDFYYTFDENTTYYANWEKQKISIVFSKNETANPNAPGEIWAQLPSSNANAKRMDESFTISGLLSSLGKSNPTRDKYQFLGWATSPTATIPEYGGLAWPNIVQFNRDMNLYAVWEYIECRVYFKTAIGEVQMAANAANGIGEGQNDEGRYLTIRKGQPFAGDMPSCKRSGGDQTEEDMEFLGWFTQPIGGSIVTSNTSIEGETRLFSQWTSKDAMDAYQSRSQNIDEYLKELLSQLQDVLDEDGNPTGETVKVDPAEEKRKAMAALFDTANGGANQTAYRLSNAGMEPAMVRPTTPQTRITVYFYSDGSSESGLRHEHPEGRKTYNVCCDHYTWEFSTYRYKLPAASSPDGKDNYFLMVPVFPMMNMGTTPPKTWRDYKFPQDDFTIPNVFPNVESTKDGVQAPLWSKAGQNTPGWVLMDMTKNRGWGKALETGATIPHNKTEQTAAYGGVTFSSSVTYFNNIYSPDLDRNSYTIKWIWLNEQLRWNGCYSFWADFSPKPTTTAEVGERIKAFPDRL